MTEQQGEPSGLRHDRGTQPARRSETLRYSRALTIPAGQEWPSCDPGAAVPPKRFRWISVENRGVHASGTDVWVSFTEKPNVNDLTSVYMIVPAGTSRVRRVAGDGRAEATPLRLRLLNVGAATIVVWLEVDNAPLYDKVSLLSP
jgi:hypothetical protein